jgi:hypothetical protein
MPELASPALLWPEMAREGVQPLVLRDYERLPDAVSGGDLDLALRDATQLPAAERAIRRFAAATGLQVASLLRRSYVWEIKLSSATPSRQLIIDLHTEGEGWRGPLYLTNDELFAAARNRGLWWEPAPHHQAMMAAFQHLLWGGFYKAKYHPLVPAWIARDEAAFTAAVARAFGDDVAPRLVALLQQADAPALARLVPELRRRLWQHRGLADLPGSLRRLGRFVTTEIRLTFARHGRWVVFVGPDGVGKTTVAGWLAGETEIFFRSTLYHHWIPDWRRPLAAEVPPGGSKPTARPPGQGWMATLVSVLRLTRNVVRAHLGYWLRILPALWRQRLVIGDRYLFNYHLDPPSVRYYGPPGLVRLALRLVPQPDLVILLAADPEVIHRRKAELEVPAIRRILERARELPGLGIPLVEIAADELPEKAAAAVAAVAIGTLAAPQASADTQISPGEQTKVGLH